MATPDYYKTLGVPRTATADEVKKAFRKLARTHHPDAGGDEAKFKELNEAYEASCTTSTAQRTSTRSPRVGAVGTAAPSTLKTSSAVRAAVLAAGPISSKAFVMAKALSERIGISTTRRASGAAASRVRARART